MSGAFDSSFSGSFGLGEDTAWASIEQAHAHWPDSASLPEATLSTLLLVATAQCQNYAPYLAFVPNRYMVATVYQAREVYAAGQRDGDIIGIGDYAIRARPLTSTVKSLLRPQAGVPKVG